MSAASDSQGRPAKTLYLHIGLHKTGTTYLQRVMHANKDELASHDVFFPGEGQMDQMLAVWDLFGRRPRGARDGRIIGKWDALSRAVNDDGRAVTLISEEYLSLATVAQARRLVANFPGTEVHVLVTARDLARVVVSAWQEVVKNESTQTCEEFTAAIQDPRARAQNPARRFWQAQDLPVILQTWSAAVPAERIHIITVPPSGSDQTELLGRFAGVVGFDHTSLPNEPKWDNQTLGVAGTEVVRRLNGLLGHRLNERQYDRSVKLVLVPELARQLGSPRFGLPPDQLDWVRSWALEAVAKLDDAGYDVVGDLSELVPLPQDGLRPPDDASTEELLEAAMAGSASLTERHATVWWNRKRPDAGAEDVPGPARVASAARGFTFRAQRRVAELADRNAAVAWLMGVYLDVRARTSRRASRR